MADAADWPVPPGWILHPVNITDSTNDDAKVAVRTGCPDRTVFLADEQRSGRGRLGRSWIAPAGSSLLVSVVLHRPLPPIALTAATSVAVAGAIRSITGRAAQVKWPNDVMVADRKVCGILTEVVLHEGCPRTIVGIGLNVNLDPAAAGLPPTATSLSAGAGRAFSRQELLTAILTRLDGCLAMTDAQFAPYVWHRWHELLWRRDQTIRVDQEGSSISGIVDGIGASGALLVRLADGSVVEITTGDVSAL